MLLLFVGGLKEFTSIHTKTSMLFFIYSFYFSIEKKITERSGCFLCHKATLYRFSFYKKCKIGFDTLYKREFINIFLIYLYIKHRKKPTQR